LEKKDFCDDKNSNISQICYDSYNFENCINVYTDGCCINNGKDNAVASCGVYFGVNDNINKSFKLKKKANYNITNNRAELKAILTVFKILKKEIENNETIVIHTDSQYCITVLTSTKIINKNLKKYLILIML
jgi:ribonuclease HI